MSTGPPHGPQPPDWPDAYTSQNGASSRAQSAAALRLVTLSYILAISVPPLGLAFGIALLLPTRRHRSNHGVGVIVLSIITAAVWILVATSGTLNTPSTNF